MKDFWLSSGLHLLERDSGRGLVVTDEFLKAYFDRPELAPPPGCDRRRTDAARRAAGRSASQGERKGDRPPERSRRARELAADAGFPRSSPAAPDPGGNRCASLLRDGAEHTPSLFINQLVHVILRNALDGCEDAYVLRAAELFFREQRLTVHDDAR